MDRAPRSGSRCTRILCDTMQDELSVRFCLFDRRHRKMFRSRRGFIIKKFSGGSLCLATCSLRTSYGPRNRLSLSITRCEPAFKKRKPRENFRCSIFERMFWSARYGRTWYQRLRPNVKSVHVILKEAIRIYATISHSNAWLQKLTRSKSKS